MNQRLVAPMALIIMETTAAATVMVSRMEKDHKMVAVMVQVVMEMVEMALMVVLMVPIRVMIQVAILVKTKTMRRSHANPIPYKSSVKASWLQLIHMKESKKDNSFSWKFTQLISSADLA